MWKLALLGSVALSFALGCKGAPPPAVPHGGPEDAILEGARDALVAAGHECQLEDKGVLCDKGGLMFVVVTTDRPVRQLGIVVISKMKVPCDDALPLFNKVNREVDIMKLHCDDKGTFVALGTHPIPDAGLAKPDVARWTRGFLAMFVAAVKEYGLADAIR